MSISDPDANNEGKLLMIRNKTIVMLISIVAAVCLFAPLSYGSVKVESIKPSQGTNNPYKIAVSSKGYIYVTDTGNNSIKKLDQSGKLLSSFGAYGEGVGQFKQPQGIAVDTNDNVYVSDTGNNRIQILHDDGVNIYYAGNISSYGDGSALRLPRAIKIDDSGMIYVVDGSNRVVKMTKNGSIVQVVEGAEGARASDESSEYLSTPYGEDIDKYANIYIADTRNNTVKKYSSGGDLLLNYGKFGQGNGQFLFPNDVAVASDGYIYVADTGNHRVQKFDGFGNYVATIGSMGKGTDQFISPRGLFIDNKNGYLYVISANDRIQKYDIAVRLLDVNVKISRITSGESNYLDFVSTITVPEECDIRYDVYDTKGNHVIKLAEKAASGRVSDDQTWNGRDYKGDAVSDTEQYLYRISGTTKNGSKSIVPDESLFSADLKPPVIYDFFTSRHFYNPEMSGSLEGSFKVTEGGAAEVLRISTDIIDAYGKKVINVFSSGKTETGEFNFTWDGRDAEGNAAKDGKYKCVVTAVDMSGNVGTAAKEIVLDTSAPKVPFFYVSSTMITPNNDGRSDIIYFRYKVADAVPEVYIKLKIKSLASATIRTYSNTGTPGYFSEYWDGKDEADNIVPDGQYKYELTVSDITGNQLEPIEGGLTSINAPTVMVDAEPKIFYPTRVDTNSTAITYVINYYGGLMSGESSVTVNIYDQSGTKVYYFSDTKAEGLYTHIWAGKNNQNGSGTVPDGMYTMDILSNDPAGTIYNFQTNILTDTSSPTIMSISLEAGGALKSIFNPYVDGAVTAEFVVGNDSQFYPTTGNYLLSAEVMLGSTEIVSLASAKVINAGNNEITWSGTNKNGDYVNEGDYTLRFTIKDMKDFVSNSFTTTETVSVRDDQQLTNHLNGSYAHHPLLSYNGATLGIKLITGESYGQVILNLDAHDDQTGDTNDYRYFGFEIPQKLSGAYSMWTDNHLGRRAQVDGFIYNEQGGTEWSDGFARYSAPGYSISGNFLTNALSEGRYQARAHANADTEDTSNCDQTARSQMAVAYFLYKYNCLAGCNINSLGSWNSFSGSSDLKPYESIVSYAGGAKQHKVFSAGFYLVPALTYIGNKEIIYAPGEKRLSNAAGYSINPSVAADTTGQKVYAAWEDYRNGKAEIFFNRSLNEGVTWSSDSLLASASGNCSTPTVATDPSGNSIYVIFSKQNGSHYELNLIKSTDGGNTWSSPARITRNEYTGSEVLRPSAVCDSGGNAYVAWEDTRTGTSEIWFQKIPSNFAPISSAGYTTLTYRNMEIKSSPIYRLSSLSTLELISPVGGLSVNTLRPAFRWYGLTGQKDYRIECSTLSDEALLAGTLDYFTITVPDVSSSRPICEYLIPEHSMGLDESTPNHPYWYWRVRTVNTSEASTSEVGSFRIELPMSLTGVTNWPNPFNPNKERTKIRYRLGRQPDSVTIRIYDITGSLVKEMEGSCNAEGTSVWNKYNDVEWDGRNGRGDMVLNGVYPFEVIVSSGNKSIKGRGKAVVLK